MYYVCMWNDAREWAKPKKSIDGQTKATTSVLLDWTQSIDYFALSIYIYAAAVGATYLPTYIHDGDIELSHYSLLDILEEGIIGRYDFNPWMLSGLFSFFFRIISPACQQEVSSVPHSRSIHDA